MKDVMVKIKDHYVPTDFMVLDMGKEDDVQVILGRPFLHTTSAIIYVKSGEVHFQFPKRKVRCYFNSYTNYEQPKKNKSRRHRPQKKEIIKDGWADYEGEVVRSDDVQEQEKKDPKTSETQEVRPQTDQV